MGFDESDGGKRGTPPVQAERRSYDVGYGKPPKATQFGVRPQPSRHSEATGARSGRTSDLARFLDQPIEVKLNGRTTKLHPHEATLHGLFARTIKGQLRPIKQFLRECERAGLLDPEVLQHSAVIHAPKDIPFDLACYVLIREGRPPWSKETLRPYLAEYERDLARLKTLKEDALRQARAGGENVY
ncbi:hypothetical protein [Bradyrhizobium sp. WSM471]|uniref:hypothetical protein n=1 Tax=Bradyrhizobium sp. WSM471 TaxID=319017 RepID=UPI00024D2A80|nr:MULTISPECIES: hypothetical protein [Bradyrhizobium]EHR04593.1 hypothetical protein Bra471DRAFT_05396 [Bradyrhizobium sp. WSM471]UFW39744.1 hypothetical protein BcanWSM471_26480 [Bradyrhizobium canariense]